MSSARKPLIGITCCTDQLGLHPFHIVGEKYILGIVQGADGMPVLIPALGEQLPVDQLLDTLDGLMFQCRAPSLCGARQRRRHPARPQARCHHPAAYKGSDRPGRSRAVHMPGIPGNERGIRRQPAPASA